MAAYDWSLSFGSAAFLYVGVIVSFVTAVLKGKKIKKTFRLSPQWGEKNSSLIAGDNFKTYYPSYAVSSQSAKMNSDSKSPRIPLKPHSSSSFSSSSSLAPLCSLCTAVVTKCCLRLLRITRLLLVSVRHLYKEQRAKQDQATGNRKSHTIHLGYVYLPSDRGCSIFHLFSYFLRYIGGNDARKLAELGVIW